MDKKQRIETLTKKEVATLYLICHGLTNSQVAEALHAADKTIGTRITKIYLKLEIEGDDQQKRSILLRDYCPIVRKYSENELKYWIPKEPPPEVKLKYEIIEYQYPEPDPEPETWWYPPPPPPTSGTTETYVEERRVRRLIFIFLGIIALLVVGFVIIYFFFPPENPLIPPRNTGNITVSPDVVAAVSPSTTETPTITTDSSGQTVPEELPEIPTDTPSATPTSTNTPTDTPTPTNTPTPTETPIPTPTPEIIFFDDFSGDLSKWTQLGLPPYYPNNRVVIANEAMTTSDPYGSWVKAEIPAETNYQIIINFKGNGCGGDGNYFSPAFIDNSNMISFNADACHYVWGYTEGSTAFYKYSDTTGLNGPGNSEVIITVEGKKLSSILNKVDAGSVVNDKYPQGIIAIFIRTGDSVDDVTVIALQE